mmetsp:Transcript_146472/g.467904  ORF Transcript_146472/g.467904 Transcript_146472/m.467904 type:complete len:232 (+) Transcript_146472:152-847(+)
MGIDYSHSEDRNLLAKWPARRTSSTLWLSSKTVAYNSSLMLSYNICTSELPPVVGDHCSEESSLRAASSEALSAPPMSQQHRSAMSPAASHAAISVLSLPEVDELPLVGDLSEAGFATCGVSRLAKLLTHTAEPTRTIAELDFAIDASKRVMSREDSEEPMRTKLLTDSDSEPRSTTPSGPGAAAPKVRPRPPVPVCGWACSSGARLRNWNLPPVLCTMSRNSASMSATKP